MIAGLDTVGIIILIFIYIIAGRRFAYFPGFIRVNLHKIIRRAMFLIDIKVATINICGIVWQTMFILTLIGFSVGYLMVDKIMTKEYFTYITGVIILSEWIGIGVPMAIYCGICQLIQKRRRNNGSSM